MTFPGSEPQAYDAQPVVIRPARLRDLWAVERIQRRAFKPRLAYGLGTLVMLWLLPGVRFLVARRDGTIVGCVLGDRHQGQARVVNLAVEPNAQRQGIGKLLLAALEEALPDGNAVLMVEQDNTAARALYAANGYAEIRQAWDYYGRGRHGVWMEKRRTGEPSPVLRV